MPKKKLSIAFIIIMFLISLVFLFPHERTYKVIGTESPVVIILENGKFKINDLDCFDSYYSDKNKKLAKDLNISEDEAFVLGNLGKYWAENLIKNRRVYADSDGNLIYFKYSYRTKFNYSGFCVQNGKPCNNESFEKRINEIRNGNYKILDLDSDSIYDVSSENAKKLNNYLVIRRSHLPKKMFKSNFSTEINKVLDKGDIKIYFSDHTTKLKPDRNCSSDICKEILKNINRANNSIDVAIYGYSRVPAIETALKQAIQRGVKIRLVYDLDSKGRNIYPDTKLIAGILTDNRTDKDSFEAKNIMHNKFYIFDDEVVITGSANLSHTDMSGFNSNSIVVINSKEASKIYKSEFEQMYGGKFHGDKAILPKSKIILGDSELEIYFSPKDKALTNGVLPLIEGAKNYIYLPIFVLSDKRVAEALISAKKRGVDVKIIGDALNSSVKHSKHTLLRNAGIMFKTENYAGKMHSKSMIIDDMYTVIGSMNFSNSGENRNDENLIIIKDPKIAKFYKDFFIYQWGKIDNKWLTNTARAEGYDSIGSCDDGIDNNYDGLTDKYDPACK